jgi:hypothetical protein
MLLASEREYAMFEHFKRYSWVLPMYYYTDIDDVIASLEEKVIWPAEEKAREMRRQQER